MEGRERRERGEEKQWMILARKELTKAKKCHLTSWGV